MGFIVVSITCRVIVLRTETLGKTLNYNFESKGQRNHPIRTKSRKDIENFPEAVPFEFFSELESRQELESTSMLCSQLCG